MTSDAEKSHEESFNVTSEKRHNARSPKTFQVQTCVRWEVIARKRRKSEGLLLAACTLCIHAIKTVYHEQQHLDFCPTVGPL
jgi:hypothetical protein